MNPGPTLEALSPALQELILAAVKVALIIPALQGVFSLMTWIERRVLAFMESSAVSWNFQDFSTIRRSRTS